MTDERLRSIAGRGVRAHFAAMMHFGSTTLIDLLSWIVALSLGAKLLATLFVLLIDRQARDRPGWGSSLWWVIKITPLIAVPCLVWIALFEEDRDLTRLFLALGAFVLFAVPLAIHQRRKRMARRR